MVAALGLLADAMRVKLRALISDIIADKQERDTLINAMWVASLAIFGDKKRYEKIYGKRLVMPRPIEVKRARAHLQKAEEAGQVTPRDLHLSDAAYVALLRLADLSGAVNVEEVLVALLLKAQSHNGLVELDSLTMLFNQAYVNSLAKREMPLWTLPTTISCVRAFNAFAKNYAPYSLLNRFARFLLVYMPTFFYFWRKYVKKITGADRQKALENEKTPEFARKKILTRLKEEQKYERFIEESKARRDANFPIGDERWGSVAFGNAVIRFAERWRGGNGGNGGGRREEENAAGDAGRRHA